MPPLFENLVQVFKRFPGIGLRQARRFVYFILQQDESYIRELITTIQQSRKGFRLCEESFQWFYDPDPTQKTSPIVREESRSPDLLMIILNDMDLEAIERSRMYKGHYFVLGGLVPIIETNMNESIRLAPLLHLIKKHAQADILREIILAFPVNPEGEHTRTFIQHQLEGLLQKIPNHTITITTLGRGLSTGTELEYIDRDTFENAFLGRK